MDPARKLLLVRHSLPEMVTGVPASRWSLSVEGRRRCEVLAERLAGHGLTAIITSEEPKAVETGEIMARILGLPLETAPGLHEHERGVVRDLGSQDEFRAQVAALFEHPDQRVLGRETANQAHARFAQAVACVLERTPAGNLAIVSHGTVITLFVARANRLSPFGFWSGLSMPAYTLLALPDLQLLEIFPEVRGT